MWRRTRAEGARGCAEVVCGRVAELSDDDISNMLRICIYAAISTQLNPSEDMFCLRDSPDIGIHFDHINLR